ncbi:MAG: TolC family protein [Pseudomonadales bacterium]|nr:TolC family protein [Pseudomonadales bacterium]MCP5358486.1 TolC family protein [Pseudomonadales bacterium]
MTFPCWNRGRLCVPAALLCLCAVLLGTAQAQVADAPLTLDEAIRLTLTRNPELLAFGYALRAQEGRELQASLRPRPTLTVGVEDALGTGVAKGLEETQATVAIAWILEGDRRQRRIDVARAGSEVLADQARVLRLDAAAQTARLYTSALEQLLHRDIADAALALAQETVAAVERRVQAGTTTTAELARARAEEAKRALYREDVDHQINAARHRLTAQWGDMDADTGDLVPLPAALPVVEAFETLLSRIEQNPDLDLFLTEARQQESLLRLEQADSKAPWEVSTGLRRYQGSADFGLVAELSIPFNAGNRNQGRIREVTESLAQTRAEREAARLRLQTRLRDMHLELTHSLHRIDALRDEVIPRFEDALEQIRRAWELGSASYLEQLQVQEELLNARSELAETLIQARLDIIEIERITGVSITLPATAPGGAP